MQADFEEFKKMSPEERKQFREERNQRYDKMSAEEKKVLRNQTKQGLIAMGERLDDINLRLELGDVANAVSLSYIAKNYFGKSKAWLYQKLNGHKVNGKPAQFTDEEKKRFAEALHDLSQRIEETALKFT